MSDSSAMPLPAAARPSLPERILRYFTRPEFLLPLLSALIGLGLWEAAVRINEIPTYLLPAPSVVAVKMVVSAKLLFRELAWTAFAAAAGLIVAVTFGVLAGAGVAISHTLDRMLTPWLVTIHAVPKVVVAPLFLVWFGFGLQSEIFFVITFTFFPVIVATVTGLKSADPEIFQLVRSMGASRAQTLRKIMFPSALPSVLSGIKLSTSLAPVGAIIGEFVASNKGLGHLLIRAVGDMDTTLAFAAVVLFSIFGVVIWRLAEFAEAKLQPWHPSQRGNMELLNKM